MATTRPARLTVLASLATLAFAAAACGGTTELDSGDGVDERDGTDELLEQAGATTIALAESDDELDNPERGFYGSYNLVQGTQAHEVVAEGHTLAISVVNLRDFRTGLISSSFLQDLRDGFDGARAAGIKIILRFKYNDDYTADAPLPLVLQHIEQLAPIIRDNADVIAVVQGGFVGAHGEWHSSTFDLDVNPDARRAIIGALLDAVPASRSVQIRKPEYKYDFLDGTVTADEAFTASDRARLGHHNDCFLASSSDYGTYESSSEKELVAADSKFVPMGGETCALHERNTCENALAEMAQLHWTYLNRDYHQGVIARWVEDNCDGEIRNRLGYRLVAEQVIHSAKVAPGGVLAVQLDLANRGFAAPINERPLELVLSNGSERHVATLDHDARRLPAGSTTMVAARLRLPAGMAPGTYSLSLRLPDAAPSLADDPRYSIRLANVDAWDDATGDNLLSQAIVVDASMGGDIDTTATELHQLR